MKRFPVDRRRGWLILALTLILLSGLAAPGVKAAQTGESTPEADPQVNVHIVQPGETLFAIAQEHSVPLELIAAVNNISDPAYINVGQRLIIPPSPKPQEPSIVHQVRPGETLHSLALGFNVAPEELGWANHLLRPDVLAIDQTVLVYGRTELPPSLHGRAHTPQAGETLLELALQHQTSPWALATVNRLDSPLTCWPGKRLWIPGETGEFFDWPEPLLGIQIHPVSAVQGQTISVQISLTHPVSLTGSLMGTPLSFHSQAASLATALAGISALAKPGTPTLVVTATLPSGELVRYAQPMPIVEGDYYLEDIVVADHIAAQMTAEVVQEESDALDRVFALYSPTRQWSSFFSLPAAGDVTSIFGNRRTYNIPNGSAYHTGTDFGRNVNAPVYAPADGVVIFVETLIVRGNVLIIDHGWGVLTGYWHLSASHVTPGDSVSQGQHIGDIGNTGLSTGPHLHWELRVGGVPVDGLQWVREEFP